MSKTVVKKLCLQVIIYCRMIHSTLSGSLNFGGFLFVFGSVYSKYFSARNLFQASDFFDFSCPQAAKMSCPRATRIGAS